VFAGNMQAGAMKPQHSAGAIIKITIGKNGDLQQLFHTRFSKNLDFIGVSAGLNRRKTPVSALRPPTALRPKPPAAPLRVSGICKPLSGFLQHSKAKEKGKHASQRTPHGNAFNRERLSCM
jgi:hypothetical protein